jgi:hypothetical protein
MYNKYYKGLNMFKKLFVIFSICITSCNSLTYKAEIIKIDSNYKEIILKKSSDKHVWGLYLNIVGNDINEINIDFLRSDSDYIHKIYLTNENNEYSYNGDYYGDIVTLRIYSQNNNGKLIIKYYFKCLY